MSSNKDDQTLEDLEEKIREQISDIMGARSYIERLEMKIGAARSGKKWARDYDASLYESTLKRKLQQVEEWDAKLSELKEARARMKRLG